MSSADPTAAPPKYDVIATLRARRALPAPSMCRAIREASGTSREQLGRAIGVTGQAVAFWEAGTRKPRPLHLERYADLLRQLQAEMTS
jgi:DNA-binding transcriptional regulator YiaG